MKRLEWYIARRYLAARRKGRFLSLSTAIAVGGIFLGVAALITVIGVMTGLQRELRELILGSNPHVYVFEYGQSFRMSNWEQVLEQVRQVPGVVAAQPFIQTHVAITSNREYVQPGILYGIDPEAGDAPLTGIDAAIQSGELRLGPTASGHPGILVGRRLAEKMMLMPGHVVTIGALEGITYGPLGDPVFPAGNFEVTGFITTGMYEYDTQHMYATLDAVRDLLGIDPDVVGGIGVNVEDPWRADRVATAIAATLGFPYWPIDWMDLNRALFSALQLEKLAMAIILFLIVVVAAFNIISLLIMLVTDKTREIGILKSMGMSDGRVLRIFMVQGLTIGLIGTALGAPTGLFLIWLQSRYELIKLAPDVYFVEALPVALTPTDIVLIIGLSVLIAFAATIYPARQASRLTPVEAIRHD